LDIQNEFQLVLNLHSLYNVVCLAEKQKIPMLWSLVSAVNDPTYDLLHSRQTY